MSSSRVAVDIGGTFTDVVVQDAETGRSFAGKVLSTPDDPAVAVLRGLREMTPDLSGVTFLVHGTTVGLNALLERRGARVLLVTTRGFKDVYTIAGNDRKDMFDLRYTKPAPLVRPRDVMEVTERLRADGTVLEPLDLADVDAVAERVRTGGYDAVAVCLLHAYVNPDHEVAVRDRLTRQLPDVPIALSHEVTREWREYPRTSTTVMNAYISPVVGRYLTTLQGGATEQGVRVPLYVMQSNGGAMTAEAAEHAPIQTLLSGPVGGSIGGRAVAEAMRRPNLVCIDMGGTSFDASLVVGGEPSVSREAELEGLPVLMSVVDIHVIGAGGGSIAYAEGGALRVGPRSAGSVPGPACYGQGGLEPTVTDANLVLGRVDANYFAGGDLALDHDAAVTAVRRLAGDLDLAPERLAEGVLTVVNAKMADALRVITIKQGIDPRDFALLAYGGAGPMHAAALADELDIDEIVVPASPGTFSAYGMLQTDIRHGLSQTFFRSMDEVDRHELEAALRQLEDDGVDVLRAEGVDRSRMRFTWSVDMRYVAQEYSVTVAYEPGEDALAALGHRFHDSYRARYGHANPGAPVEIVNVRVDALGVIDRPPPRVDLPGGDSWPMTRREVVFDGAIHDTAIVRRTDLPAGAVVDGPAIVEEATSTTVVPPAWRIRVEGLGNLVMTRRVTA